MKILTTSQIKETDAYTIANEPIASVDLMERASMAFFTWFTDQFDTQKEVWIFCGTGNNGGDGLAIARLLHEKKYVVKVLVINPQNSRSDDFEINYQRALTFSKVQSIQKVSDIQIVPDDVIAIDGLFGSGLTRPIRGFYTSVVESINKSQCTTVAIDIPSGLFADEFTNSTAIIKADYTISFQVPKLAFLLQNSGMFVGKWKVVDIGLSRYFIDQCKTDHYLMTMHMMKSLISPREKYGHKGTYGHALLVAGSYGKMGAAVLSGRAAMRSGLGLLTMHGPICGVDTLQSSTPEAMVSVDPTEFYFGEAPDISKYSAIGIGPGLGQHTKTAKALGELLAQLTTPVVIDADAINIITNQHTLLSFIPERSILTPHYREFERLAGTWNNDFHRLSIQKQFSKDHKVIIVFKGPHTAISTPEGEVYFNNTGNSGMATAGSGDVLTGLITGFLAQGHPPLEAAKLGVYIHGLAGGIAAKHKGMSGMIASDIIEMIPEALLYLS